VEIKNIVYSVIGLTILFVITGSIMMTQFSNAWRYCQARQWVGAQGGALTNCTTPYQTSNTTYVNPAGAEHTENGLTSPIATDNANANSFCLNCATLGGYRTTVQGLTLLVLAIGFIGFGLYFMKKR